MQSDPVNALRWRLTVGNKAPTTAIELVGACVVDEELWLNGGMDSNDLDAVTGTWNPRPDIPMPDARRFAARALGCCDRRLNRVSMRRRTDGFVDLTRDSDDACSPSQCSKDSCGSLEVVFQDMGVYLRVSSLMLPPTHGWRGPP